MLPRSSEAGDVVLLWGAGWLFTHHIPNAGTADSRWHSCCWQILMTIWELSAFGVALESLLSVTREWLGWGSEDVFPQDRQNSRSLWTRWDLSGCLPSQNTLLFYNSRKKQCAAKERAQMNQLPMETLWKTPLRHSGFGDSMENWRAQAVVTEETKYLEYDKKQLNQLNSSVFITVGEAPASPLGSGWGVRRAVTLW